jgi:hypothetical protein
MIGDTFLADWLLNGFAVFGFEVLSCWVEGLEQ